MDKLHFSIYFSYSGLSLSPNNALPIFFIDSINNSPTSANLHFSLSYSQDNANLLLT